MTERRFEIICEKALKRFKKMVPYTPYSGQGKYHSSGNMRNNALKMDIVGFVCKIYIDDGDGSGSGKNDGVAPYVPYTNEPWTSPKWKGKKNPNEGWFDTACMTIIFFIRAELKGELKKL